MLKIGVAGEGALRGLKALPPLLAEPWELITVGKDYDGHVDILASHDPEAVGPGVSAGVTALNADALAADTASHPSLNAAPLFVTYGLNAKACVTASSVTAAACAVCVQRAFEALSGGMCVQCEFTLPIPPGAEAVDVLAAAVIGLLTGVLPVEGQ